MKKNVSHPEYFGTPAIAGLPAAADLYCDLEPPPPRTLRSYLPGLIVTALATMAAAYLSDRYGAPLTLMALLVGLSLNFLRSDARLHPGLAFASGTLLRISIVLVGAQVTLAQMADLGLFSLAAVLLIVAATIGSAVLVARLLGLGPAFGALAGGAVAICGASAALAVYTTLGEKRVNQSQLALVLVGISAISSLAMILYPVVAHHLGLGDMAAGFFLGASIHDVAQTLGAGYTFSASAGEVAAIVKMTRVALLAPALMVVALFFADKAGGRPVRLLPPWFVLGFFGVAALGATGLVPDGVASAVTGVTPVLLAAAVTATGIRAPMEGVVLNSMRPLLAIIAASLVAATLAVSAALLFF